VFFNYHDGIVRDVAVHRTCPLLSTLRWQPFAWFASPITPRDYSQTFKIRKPHNLAIKTKN